MHGVLLTAIASCVSYNKQGINHVCVCGGGGGRMRVTHFNHVTSHAHRVPHIHFGCPFHCVREMSSMSPSFLPQS